MLILQAVNPYGLNDRVGDEYMTKKIVELLAINWKQTFVKIFTLHLDHNLKVAGYFICVSIKSLTFLKNVCSDVYDFLSNKADSFPNQQWYEMTLDFIESRTYNPPASKTTKTKPKNLIKLQFVNKGVEMVNTTKIINHKNVKKNLTTQFNKTE